MDRPYNVVEEYRHEIYRIAWKIQYRAKVQRNRELIKEETPGYAVSFTEVSDSQMDLSRLIDSLPSTIGKAVIHQIFILDKTEKQVAEDLNISQQAVSKWKKKMLGQLCLMLNSQHG